MGRRRYHKGHSGELLAISALSLREGYMADKSLVDANRVRVLSTMCFL